MTGDLGTAQSSADGAVARLLAVARERGRADPYVGKRRWTRYAIGMRLEITDNPQRPGNTWTARTHNISGGGLGFWSRHEIPTGTRLYLRELSEQPTAWAATQVAYCTRGIGGCLIGVAFGSPSQEDAVPGVGTPSGQQRTPGLEAAGAEKAAGRSLLGLCALQTALAGGAAALIGTLLVGQRLLPDLWTPVASLASGAALGALAGGLMLRREARVLKALHAAIRELVAGLPSSGRLPAARSREITALGQAILNLGGNWRRHDDAQRIQRQRLEELAHIKSSILSTVSHDLRTPLTSILLYARMLTEELETMPRENQRRFLEIITDECRRLSRLVDDLLEVQRLESGRVQWNMKRQDLSETILACARVFQAMASGNSIEFTISCADTLPPLEADADKIAQVISNLLSNAMKYTPPGGRVHLSSEVRGNQIVLCVADSGPGIPRDKWDQIFDRFVQLPGPEAREIKGVGLGLCIVREVVQRHGGRVWVDSEIGRGSEFYVALPIETASAPSPNRAADDPPAGRVVFCDADPELAAAASQILHQAGYDVNVVHSANRLLEHLAQHQSDVVVTDVLLPDLGGPDLLDALGTLKERSFQLVLHSYERPDHPTAAGKGGIFLERPASSQDLLTAVRLACARKSFPTGMTLLLVRGDEGDLEPLAKALADRGHACLSMVGIGAAADLLRVHEVDLVIVDARALGLGWGNLSVLRRAGGDMLHIAVLCEEVRTAERRRAEMQRVKTVLCAPGAEEAAADAVLAPAEGGSPFPLESPA